MTTRERILEASGELFARDGFHRAGVRDICARAECNVASVKYYFGDKLGLYRELVTKGTQDILAARPPRAEALLAADPEAALGQWLRQFLELTLVHRHNHPYIGRILRHELSDPTEVLDEVVQSVMKPVHRDLTQILSRITGQPAAAMRQVAGLILSMCANLETSRPMFERLSAKLPATPEALDKFAAELTRMVLFGIAGKPQP